MVFDSLASHVILFSREQHKVGGAMYHMITNMYTLFFEIHDKMYSKMQN